MGWREVVREAQDRLADGGPLTLESWRAVMAAVAPVAGEDPAVVAVAGMAAGSGSFRGATPADMDPLVAGVVEAVAGGWDPEVGRTAVAAVTHLALRSAADERHEQVLAAAERELLVHRSPSPLSAALRAWRDQVAVTDVGPHEAVAIAVTQTRLLREACGWIDQVEAPPGLELQELRAAVVTAAEAWQLASTTWSDVARTERVSPAGVTELSRRWATLDAMVRAEPSAARRVEALISTGFGGSLQAGLSVRAPGETDTVLTRVGVGVEIAADPLHGISFQDRTLPTPRQQPTGQVAYSPTKQTPPQDPATSAVVSRWRGGVEIDPEVENTHAGHVAAARMMQAGVVAQAALDGHPEAVRAAAGVPRQRLEELVERGRLGKAQLIAFTRPMVVAALREDLARRRGPAGDDLLSAAQTHVAEQITTWDETRGRLAGWVWQVARQEAGRWVTRGQSSEQALRRHETLTDTTDKSNDPQFLSPAPGVEEQVTQAWSLRDLRTRVAALPTPEREVITARYGLDGGGAETRDVIARRLGMSPATVRRVEERAVEQLRQVQRVEIDQSLPGMTARLRQAVPRDLVTRLTRDQEQRTAANEPRPLIDRIKERAEAARCETQLGHWLKTQQPVRGREEGPEL